MKRAIFIILVLVFFTLNSYAEVLDSKEVLIDKAKNNDTSSIKVEENSIDEVKNIDISVKSKNTTITNIKKRKKKVIKGSKKIWLPWSTEIYFTKNSYRLTKIQRLKLSYIGVPRKAHIYVMGYASSRGGKKHNYSLSKSRAWVIFKYLKKKFPRNKIHFRAYGELSPRYTNKRVKGRQGNQRVKVLLKRQ